MTSTFAVELDGITKRFMHVLANDKVSLQIRKGSIHAIVGENGAGKTTIMEILYGFYQADEGSIRLFGKPVEIKSPHDAIKNQIGMVHQHFMLIPPLTVAENIVLGIEPVDQWGRLDLQKAITDVEQIAHEYGLFVDPRAKVETLSVGQEQRVEILKTLYRGAEILILDEPTAVLTPLEVKEFFTILHRLKAQGKTIILITHKLDEVLAISDEITVMRNGKKVGDLSTKEATMERISTMMVGRNIVQVEKKENETTDIVLQISKISLQMEEKYRIKQLSLEVRAGEILGIIGLEGNGQTELVEILSGLQNISEGTILYKGKDITNLPAKAIRDHKIGIIPADRKKHGYIHDYSNAENLILGFHQQPPFCKKSGLFDFANIRKFASQLVHKFDVRPALTEVFTGTLSGGNQQKIIIAREFTQNPDLLVIAQPTRGVDIGSIEFIHQKIMELRAQGKAILLISAELAEIRTLSDRAIVLYEGQISGTVDMNHFDEQEIGLMMTGQYTTHFSSLAT